MPRADEPEPPDGVFHIVQAGQTLWRIARAYGIEVDHLAAANGIIDTSRIEIGAAIFVPGAQRAVEVPPYPAPPPDAPVAHAPRPAAPPGAPDVSEGFVWPVTGEILSSFGVSRRRHVHKGLDIRGMRGETVVASRSGRVVFAGSSTGYGRMVVIEHDDGLQSLYAHAETLLVQLGDAVHQGDPIATVGRSGNATTEHVHFEIRRDGQPVDPTTLLRGVYEARK